MIIIIKKTCLNCAFNFDGICTGSKYAKNIKKLNITDCSDWHIDFSEFCNLLQKQKHNPVIYDYVNNPSTKYKHDEIVDLLFSIL